MSLITGRNVLAGAKGLWRDQRGQDLIEYALLVGFVGVAVGAFFPASIAPNISTVFSKVVGYLGLVN